MDLEQQLQDINEEADRKYISRVRKDLIAEYALNHFGPDFKVDKTRGINDLREDVYKEMDKRLGKTKQNRVDIKISPPLAKKNILFRSFADNPQSNLPPYDEVFKEDGSPRYVLCKSNKTVWEPSPGMIAAIGKEFEPCDKDGVIRRIEDYGKEH